MENSDFEKDNLVLERILCVIDVFYFIPFSGIDSV